MYLEKTDYMESFTSFISNTERISQEDESEHDLPDKKGHKCINCNVECKNLLIHIKRSKKKL